MVYVQADLGDDPAVSLYSKLGTRAEVLHFATYANEAGALQAMLPVKPDPQLAAWLTVAPILVYPAVWRYLAQLSPLRVVP